MKSQLVLKKSEVALSLLELEPYLDERCSPLPWVVMAENLRAAASLFFYISSARSPLTLLISAAHSVEAEEG